MIDDTSSLIMRKSTEHLLLVNLRDNWVGDIGPVLINGMLQTARIYFGVRFPFNDIMFECPYRKACTFIDYFLGDFKLFSLKVILRMCD